jgi:hypothetical protein
MRLLRPPGGATASDYDLLEAIETPKDSNDLQEALLDVSIVVERYINCVK